MRMTGSHIVGAFFTLVVLLALPHPGEADIYKYVDANGVVHFTDTPTGGEYKLYLKERRGGAGRNSSTARGRAVSGAVKEIVSRYSSTYRLDEALIHAVIKAESDYNPGAVSRKGAQGMMQLMPETARLMKVNDPFDVEDNIRGGSRYLREMLDEFNGNVDLAIAAYNAGPNAVRRHGGIPPYEETRNYVVRVKKYLNNYRQGKGAWL